MRDTASVSAVPESTYEKLQRWIVYTNDRLRESNLVISQIPIYWNGGWSINYIYTGSTSSFLGRLDLVGELVKSLKEELLIQGFGEVDLDLFQITQLRRVLNFGIRISAIKLERFIEGLPRV
jgi:hypothetical protein